MKEKFRGLLIKEKFFRFFKIVLLVFVISVVFLSVLGTVAHASGLVDDTINANNLYSKYPLENYSLDFYVDNSWGWLPWNWLDGIGKSVQYGLYCITNFIWTISLYLSNATGYVIQEAYKLDFINDMADSIGNSIQTIAGVTENGFSSTGFYVGFLLLLILIIGIYVAYTGMIKRETSKAIHAVINFVVVFLLSASFIAYAPDYIKKINGFSSDISTASLDLGTKIMIPDSDSKGKDSVDLIRDSLFSIQVQQPWLLLQFGNGNIEEIGSDRVEALVSTSPDDEDGETRENIVKSEIEDKDNHNLTITKVVNRLGMVFFLLIFNLGITIFVFLLTAMMIFSQILFIIFAMFLPISFLLSMIPSYNSMAKQAIVKVFNTIMTRAGITLIVTIAFSISSMFYNISSDYPFFMVAFLQIVCFAGIYMKLGDLMSMFSLNAGDSQSMGRRIFRRPYMFMRQRARRMEHGIARAVGKGALLVGISRYGGRPSTINTGRGNLNRDRKEKRNNTSNSIGSRIGSTVGGILDTKNKFKDKATEVKENIKDMPVQAGYAIYSAKEKVKSNISDFKGGIAQEQENRQNERAEKLKQHRQSIADKRMAIQKEQEAKQSQRKADGAVTKEAANQQKRQNIDSRSNIVSKVKEQGKVGNNKATVVEAQKIGGKTVEGKTTELRERFNIYSRNSSEKSSARHSKGRRGNTNAQQKENNNQSRTNAAKQRNSMNEGEKKK
ncbi:YtxH domain-containing protein [Clostridium perfringens]|nr:YtxH domain-containing protein [Clostridium perfringens]HAT4214925.1 YtxH domain-containing protein [Clostridium perfringens]